MKYFVLLVISTLFFLSCNKEDVLKQEFQGTPQISSEIEVATDQGITITPATDEDMEEIEILIAERDAQRRIEATERTADCTAYSGSNCCHTSLDYLISGSRIYFMPVGCIAQDYVTVPVGRQLDYINPSYLIYRVVGKSTYWLGAGALRVGKDYYEQSVCDVYDFPYWFVLDGAQCGDKFRFHTWWMFREDADYSNPIGYCPAASANAPSTFVTYDPISYCLDDEETVDPPGGTQTNGYT